jgi:hypothetical protein
MPIMQPIPGAARTENTWQVFYYLVSSWHALISYYKSCPYYPVLGERGINSEGSCVFILLCLFRYGTLNEYKTATERTQAGRCSSRHMTQWVPALKLHSTAPVEPHSPIYLDAIGAGPTIDPWSRQERRDSVPLRPPCHCDPARRGPRSEDTAPLSSPSGLPRDQYRRQRGGPRGRALCQVRLPVQRGAASRGRESPGRPGCLLGELARARSVQSPLRPFDPMRPARAHGARDAERRELPGLAGPGARAAPGPPGGGAARSRSGDGLACGPVREGQNVR